MSRLPAKPTSRNNMLWPYSCAWPFQHDRRQGVRASGRHGSGATEVGTVKGQDAALFVSSLDRPFSGDSFGPHPVAHP